MEYLEGRTTEDSKASKRALASFFLRNGFLQRKSFSPLRAKYLLVVPSTLRQELLQALHDDPTAGHLCVYRTPVKIQKSARFIHLSTCSSEEPGKATSNAVVAEATERSGSVKTKRRVADQPATPDNRKSSQRSHRDSASSSSSRRKSKRRSKSSLETYRVDADKKQGGQNKKEDVSKSTTEIVSVETPTPAPAEPAAQPEPSPVPELTPLAASSPEPQQEDEKAIEVPEKGADNSVHSATGALVHVVFLVLAILTFLVSLDVLSAAFKLISGRAAGRVFTNSSVLRNPVVALMIGVLVTVMVQSSSSSTSITVSMVGSNLLTVRSAVPIIMGANVGTSVTNTMISLMHIKRRDEFRRGFAAATVHDIFNWLTVLVLLPIEVAFHMLEKISEAFVHVIDRGQRLETSNYLNALTKPFVRVIVQLDNQVIKEIALGKDTNGTILKRCCRKNGTECVGKCAALFNWLDWSDTVTGACCFAIAVLTILLCFYVLVKVLTGLTQSHVVKVLTVCVNREYSFPASMLVGYLSLLLGCLITFVFQSSSAFTSALLPFAALGMLDLDRVYPLTLGSNVGTTATGLVAALAGSPVTREHALQIALCHTFFNVIGILLFYPLPFLRIPLFIARRLGETGAKYRWFVLFYLLVTFALIPLGALLLSLLGDVPFSIIMVVLISCGLFTAFINVLQEKAPDLLPVILQNWDFLPLWMHSLAPMDRVFRRHLERVPFCQVFLNEMSFISDPHVDELPPYVPDASP
nr:sodium-dependent phosphate transport protein 2C-like [Rhipicephalus microplus]